MLGTCKISNGLEKGLSDTDAVTAVKLISATDYLSTKPYMSSGKSRIGNEANLLSE